MGPLFSIVLITIIVCVVLYTMNNTKFLNAPKPKPGSSKPKPTGSSKPKPSGSGSKPSSNCPSGYIPIANGCKQASSAPYVPVPAPPVPPGTNPWDMAIAASQQKPPTQQSQGKPNTTGLGSALVCNPGYIAYNNQCITLTPQMSIGLPSNSNTTTQRPPQRPPQQPQRPSTTNLGVGSDQQPPQPQQQPQRPPQRPPQQPQQGGGGSFSTGGSGVAELAAAFAVKLVQDAKAQGLSWTEVMKKYPALAQLPFPAIDNLHRDYIGHPTVDHDESGMPITSRSLFGGLI